MNGIHQELVEIGILQIAVDVDLKLDGKAPPTMVRFGIDSVMVW